MENENKKKQITNINNSRGYILLGAFFIAIAILVSSFGFETVGSYIVGADNDTIINTNIVSANDDLILNTQTLYEKSLKDGDVYITSDIYTVPGSSTIYIIGVTNGKNISMYQRRISVTSQFDIHFDVMLYEDGDFTGGTLIDNFNKNRNNGDNSTFEIYSNPTTIDLTGATLLPFSNELKGDKKASLESSEFADYIMKKDTIYILEVTNQNPQAIESVFTWNWIED